MMKKNSIIGIVGSIVALVSGLAAAGAITKNKAPQIAMSIYPFNGFAAESLAARTVRLKITQNQGRFPHDLDSTTVNLAEQAFVAEPVTPAAVAVLALGGPQANRRSLMDRALTLSRRQQLITGWMIADSAENEDIPAILKHYDIMARASSSAAAAVIPVMAGAIANDDFVAPFTALLKKQPPWENQFWATVVATPNSLVNAARMREALYNPNESLYSYRDPELILGLINIQQFDPALKLYDLLVGSNKSNDLLENSSFENESRFQPVDWQLFSTGSYGASITNGNLQLSAISSAGGVFARQLVKLPASIVQLQAKVDSDIPQGTELSINLQCAEKSDKRPLPVKIKIEKSSTLRRINNQGSGCEYYWLDVTGRSLENGAGFDINIASISLTPLLRTE
ncbi:hypothetical protein [Sphingorhabdus sp. M41]|uniref:hypothetical protein n=1 Tax=Sphingorhabdus sp. M41 TaxID=1806885 RepID=UPI00078CDE53|nr:hypothetical protein [Sphingorhabdus sp. M41]AMO73040.1 hypothetical protein AZE99_15335 [Sphingorhabdus sp. M41]